jgi:crotonobetainyl-CoA:carnitine CoA-transferase CaiB-like acyl-CoA transferase
MKAYDLLVQAETGVAGIIGHPAGPGRVGVSVCDVACGMSAYAGVLEALVGRSRRNRGARLEVSLFDAVADWMNVPLLYFEGTGAAPQRVGLAHPSICPYGAFETFDGHLVLISIQNEREWASLCTAFLGDVANRPAVDAKVAASFRELSRERAAEILRAAQIAYGFVNDLADLASLLALRRVSIGTSAGVALVIAPAVIHDQRTLQFGPVPRTANTQTKCGASSRRNKSKTRGA